MRSTLLALTALAFVSCAIPASAENVGQATRIQRFAYQTPPQASRAPIYRLNPVVKNSKLETVPSGALEVTFTDGSKLTLGSASSVIVDNYVYAGPQGASQQTVKMTKGLFRFVSGSMPKDKVRLQTPTVSIGIRGTDIKIKVNGDGSGVVFFVHGQGFLIDPNGKNVPMGEGDMVKFGADGSIDQPKKQNWSSGDAAVDQGMSAFGQAFGGPEGGSGGGDGAGSSGGGYGGDF